ncbi:hypothetical protein J3R83DRAFT_12032 [Lanmaoa asiatica]|nr:hypothetical protein J3R83DRAFT_12032 [Lanmaoa asiatica]
MYTDRVSDLDDDDLDEQDIPGFTAPGLHSPVIDKGKSRAPDPAAQTSSASVPAQGISGDIGSSNAPHKPARQTVGGIRVETRYTGVDTLDEPITTTITRDLLSIYSKLVQVLYPRKATGREVLSRDWDLWGPLLLSLALGMMLSVNAPASQALGVFTSVVVIVSVGSLVVTIQAKVSSSSAFNVAFYGSFYPYSFFQGLCVLGYCIAPLDIAALISCFVRIIWVRAPIALAAWAWCIWGNLLFFLLYHSLLNDKTASINFLDGTKIEQHRILLAVYPLFMDDSDAMISSSLDFVCYMDAYDFFREHFCSPLLQFAAVDQDKTFTLVECPSGTGQLISRLTNDEIDIAIALTDPLIAGIAKGSNAYKLVGSYVTSPLRWYISPGSKDSSYKQISDLQGTTLGISRNGSGSQTMAYVIALQQGWPTEDLRFQINNDIRGLIDSVNDGSTSAFMWEWFTTKPFADAGECRFIGEVPTPWPSWLIAAHPTRTAPFDVREFLDTLSGHVRTFASPEHRAGPSVAFIQQTFGYPEEDVKAWLQAVAYPDDCAEIPAHVVTDTLAVLQKAGVVTVPQGGFDLAQFIGTGIAKLT